MKTIPFQSHAFEKVNLVGNKDHSDTYKCSVCGCTGKRPAFTDIVKITEVEWKKASKCTHSKPIVTGGPKKRYEVIDSPWRIALPIGTIITSSDGVWFIREDGKRVFEKGEDSEYDRRGTFKLFPNEIKPL